MDMSIVFPDKIAAIVGDRAYEENSTGMSGAAVIIFEDMVLKIEDENSKFDGTVEMLRWLEGRLPAPRVICTEKANGKQYLLMSKAEGEMLCSENNMRDIEKTVDLYARSIKMLWDVDISDCPRACPLDDQLREARRRMEQGLIDMEDCEPETFGPGGFESPEQLMKWLENNRPEEKMVLSHGDLCMPNVFAKDGDISCYIDIGDMGVAGMWRDIALCWRSLKHNCSGMYTGVDLGDYTEELFEQLGIEPDWDKINYYVLLDEFF